MPPKRSKQYNRASKARRPSVIQGALDLDLSSDDIVDSPEASTQKNIRSGKMQNHTRDTTNAEPTMAVMWSDPPVYEAPSPVEAIPDTFQDAFQDDLEDFDLQMKSSSPHTILERSLVPGTAATSAQSQRTVAVMGDDFFSDVDSPPAVEPAQAVKPTQAVKPSQVLPEVDASRRPAAKPTKTKKVKQVAKTPFDEATASQAPPAVKKLAPKPAKPSNRSKQPPKKAPPRQPKRHELMQTYDGKTPSPAMKEDKRACRGSTARKTRKQPPRVVADKKAAPVSETSNDKLINEHSLRKPQIISFSPDGPRNTGRRPPQKHQLDATASSSRDADGPRGTRQRSLPKRQLDLDPSNSREAKRPRTNAPSAAIVISSADEQPESSQDEHESSDMDDDMGIPIDSFEDAYDVVPEPAKEQKPEKQLSSTGPKPMEQPLPLDPKQAISATSQSTAEMFQHKATMRQTSYHPPARRSSRVDETGSPGPAMGGFSMNGAPVKSNEKQSVAEPLEEPQRQPPPEFRIDLAKQPSSQPKMRVLPRSLEPVSAPAPKQSSHANERQALPKLAPQPPKPTVPDSPKPIPIIGPGRSSHVTEREALPKLKYRVGSQRGTKTTAAIIKETDENAVREPVSARRPPQVSSKFMQGFKKALQPVDPNRKIEREARKEQSEHVQHAQDLDRNGDRHKEPRVPVVDKVGQAASAWQPRDQYRQGRFPEICDSNLHVVVPAIIEIFLEKLRHKQGVVEKVATLYASNGNKLVDELMGSHRNDQKVLAETYDRRRLQFINKCEKTTEGVQTIKDAMDGCGAGAATSTDVRGAAIKQAMAKLREVQAQRLTHGEAV